VTQRPRRRPRPSSTVTRRIYARQARLSTWESVQAESEQAGFAYD